MAPTTAGVQDFTNEHLVAGLTKELRSRPETIATSPASAYSPLSQKIANCLHNLACKTSPRSAKALSTNSSDSSLGEMEKSSVTETGNANQKPTSLVDVQGSGTSKLLAGVSRPPSVSGRTGSSALTGKVAKSGSLTSVSSLGVATGGKAAKTARKRTRVSKKPPTTTVQASKEEFRAKVQELTGFRQSSAPHHPLRSSGLQLISRPQAHRAPAVAMDRDVKVPVLKTEDLSSNAHVKVPAVASEVPIVKPSSSRPMGGLNYTMGYDPISPWEILLLNQAMSEDDHGFQNDFLNQETALDDQFLEKEFNNQGISSDEHSLQNEFLSQATPSDDLSHRSDYFRYENDYTGGDQLASSGFLMPMLNVQQQQHNERLEGSSYFKGKGLVEDPPSLSVESRLMGEEPLNEQMDSSDDGEDLVRSWMFDQPGGYVRSLNL